MFEPFHVLLTHFSIQFFWDECVKLTRGHPQQLHSWRPRLGLAWLGGPLPKPPNHIFTPPLFSEDGGHRGQISAPLATSPSFGVRGTIDWTSGPGARCPSPSNAHHASDGGTGGRCTHAAFPRYARRCRRCVFLPHGTLPPSTRSRFPVMIDKAAPRFCGTPGG